MSLLDPTVDVYNYSSNADSYFWNFGDGSISGAFQPSHTYAAHGDYVISLAVNNICNCPDTAEMTIEVKPSHSIFVPNVITPDGDT
ncbi:MAG: PKD domain-containing protein [Crocinitomicaceae bacterium]|nr:PKD domain-containing protein [Crocinitomicaceae bacterium]